MKPIIGTVLLLSAAAANATTWNLADDFSYSANPGGQWTYGWSQSLGGKFNLDTIFEATLFNTSGGSATGWRGDSYFNQGDYYPLVMRYSGDAGKDVNVLDGYAANGPGSGEIIIRQRSGGIVMHPAPSAYSVARWTAPQAGTYFISATFYDVCGHATTDVHVAHNGVMQFNGYVDGLGSTQHWNSSNGGIKLAAGDTIDAIVGNGHNGYTSDSTGVDLIIRNVDFPH
ncbi:MAG TPA: hypothetical protein VMG11_12705 [Steroidobacteraceae bacterium]|nr:hypothetical protein [Steroidobacteraceae bacterium]